MKWCVGSDFRPLFGPTGDLRSRERTPDTLSALTENTDKRSRTLMALAR